MFVVIFSMIGGLVTLCVRVVLSFVGWILHGLGRVAAFFIGAGLCTVGVALCGTGIGLFIGLPLLALGGAMAFSALLG